MAEFIEILSDSALKEVETLNKRLLETVENIDKINAKSKNMLTPSSANSTVKELTEQYKQQEEQIKKLQAQIQKLTEKQNNNNNTTKKNVQAILDTSKAYQSLQKQKEKAIKDAEREQARLEASASLYNKVQAKLNALSNEYKDLATRKELGISLTAKEEQRYNSLQGKIQNYDKTLKAVDASMVNINVM